MTVSETPELIFRFLNKCLWGTPMIILILSCGIFFTLKTSFFQITHIKCWLKNTIGNVRKNKNEKSKNITQFQAFCSSIGATIGTGNIIGVTAAISVGGPGAVFWMWVSSFFGMMTSYAENVLSVKYRFKNINGEWRGGPMYYIKYGLNHKLPGFLCNLLAGLFALFCILASFGMGNITQINSISSSLYSSFGAECSKTGFIVAVIIGAILLGGLKRLGLFMEKLVPFMAVFYIITSLIIICSNFQGIAGTIRLITKNAFGISPVAGGFSSYLLKNAIDSGLRRGVFSNEAGLGSSVIINSASTVKDSVTQGMWGIFGVFTDTIIMCTLTAFAVLSCGESVYNANTSDATHIIQNVYESCFGPNASKILSVAITLFALSTLTGWSYYGCKAWEYLFGEKFVFIYKFIFIALIIIGSVSSPAIVWEISDIFNGLMILINIPCIMMLSGEVFKLTKKYKNN